MTPAQRRPAEGLVRLMPGYRYDLSRLPALDPPGLPSAVAAIEAIIARPDRKDAPPPR
jgi:hypothetical protein